MYWHMNILIYKILSIYYYFRMIKAHCGILEETKRSGDWVHSWFENQFSTNVTEAKKLAKEAAFVALSESWETFPHNVGCDFAIGFDISSIMQLIKQKVTTDEKWDQIYKILWGDHRSMIHFCNTLHAQNANARNLGDRNYRIYILKETITNWDFEGAMQIILQQKLETCKFSIGSVWKDK